MSKIIKSLVIVIAWLVVELGSCYDHMRLKKLDQDQNTLIDPVPAEWIGTPSRLCRVVNWSDIILIASLILSRVSLPHSDLI
jgi:hypothetical protein